jgi:hypothetical protein
MSSGLTVHEAAIALDTPREVVEMLTGAVPSLAPGDAGLTMRQTLALHVLTTLHFVDAAVAVAIAEKAVAEANAGGNRVLAVRWGRRGAQYSWLTDDVACDRLAGAVLLLPVERMLTELALRCAEVRATVTRIN